MKILRYFRIIFPPTFFLFLNTGGSVSINLIRNQIIRINLIRFYFSLQNEKNHIKIRFATKFSGTRDDTILHH